MKYKNFSLLLVLLMSMTASQAMAYDAEIDGIYYNFSGTEAIVTRGDGYWNVGSYTGDVVIPETFIYDGTTYRVTEIGQEAFEYSKGLTSVKMPESIVKIGNWAFCNCDESLNTLTISEAVEDIGMFAFAFCSGLTSITIPQNVTRIGNCAFRGCNALEEIIVAEGNSTFDSRDNCNAIIRTATNILIQGCNKTIIPSSVTGIGADAFSYLNSFTSVTLPKYISYIDETAFSGCTLEAIIVEDGNLKYDSRDNCNAIIETSSNTLIFGCKNSFIPNGIVAIANEAFNGCKGLTSLEIPSSVERIGQYAFLYCSDLANVNFSNGLKTIGRGSFEGCAITSIIIPSSVTSIGSSAFSQCNIDKIIVERGNQIYDSRNDCNAIIETATNTLIQGCKNTIIPNTVTTIGRCAFMACAGSVISIPKSVTEIVEYAFAENNYSWNRIREIYIYAEEIPKTGGDVFWNSDIGNITLYVPSSALEDYKTTEPWSSCREIVVMPDSYYDVEINGLSYDLDGMKQEATVIFNDSYFDMEGRLTIPENVEYDGKTYKVTGIDGGAFLYCTGLTGLTLGNNVQTIGSEAFMGCNGITTLIIPQSVTSIAPGAFTDCSGLSNILVRSGNSVYDSRGNCSAIIETATDALVLGCKKTLVPDDVKAIAAYAFAGCTSLTSVNIPEGVTSVGQSAFTGCTDLTEVYCYAQSVPETEAYVFSGVPTASATLYVPFVALDAYKAAAPWSKFGTIEVLPGDNTPVSSIRDANEKVLDCYDLNGQKQSQLHKGLNIVRMSDGTVKKVLVK